jgi:hypothetical protein
MNMIINWFLFWFSDPYVRIFFNGILLGQTNHIKNTLNPNFQNQNEDFLVVIPHRKQLEDCKLEVQVIDHDNLSQGDLLGMRIITGPELARLFHASPYPSTENGQLTQISPVEQSQFWTNCHCEYQQGKNSVYFPLQKADIVPADIDQVELVKGDVELKVVVLDPFHMFPDYDDGSQRGFSHSTLHDKVATTNADHKFPIAIT